MFQSSQILEKSDGTRSQTKVRSILIALSHTTTDTGTIRDIVTRKSFLNAIAVINVIGGSTNAVCTVTLIACPLSIDECRFSTFSLWPGPLK
jgi:dihydroxyacid dehydratase/phosphogluconate dehydratase